MELHLHFWVFKEKHTNPGGVSVASTVCAGLTSDILPAKLPILATSSCLGQAFSTLFPATEQALS